MIKPFLTPLKIPLFGLTLSSLLLLSPVPTQGDTCTPTYPATTCSNTQGVDVTATVLSSSASFSGYSSPNSVITFQENGTTLDTVVADATGAFTKTVNLEPGVHSLTAFSVDNQGLITPSISFENINVGFHTDTPVDNILFPPTINLSKASISIGETVVASGQGMPISTVSVFLNGKKIGSSVTDNTGKWQFNISSLYSVGRNDVYANIAHPGFADSDSSNTVSFNLVDCSAGTSGCNPVVTPANPGGSSSNPSTPITEKKNYNIAVKIGLDLGGNLTGILLTFIFTFQFFIIIFLIIFLLWWLRRRKKKKEILEELEEKVERDLKLDHAQERVEKDFWEAEHELD